MQAERDSAMVLGEHIAALTSEKPSPAVLAVQQRALLASLATPARTPRPLVLRFSVAVAAAIVLVALGIELRPRQKALQFWVADETAPGSPSVRAGSWTESTTLRRSSDERPARGRGQALRSCGVLGPLGQVLHFSVR